MRPPRGRRGRLMAVITATIALVAWIAPASRADGDPASDYLLSTNVYFPYSSVSKAIRAEIDRVVDDVYAHGNRVKVALIYDQTDLGSIPSLFGRPSDYAHFLGLEISPWYVGPLLVVMPTGFGVYDGGRPTTTEADALQSIQVTATTPDDLARTAADALRHLDSTGALRSRDVTAPLVTVHPVSGRRGKQTGLRFDLYDDSGWTRAVLRIYDDHSLLTTLASPMRFRIGTRSVSIRWRIPKRKSRRPLRFCVVAADLAGNRSAPVCAPFLRIS
jgi:hypothetical protein